MHRKRELRFEKSQLVEFCRQKKKVDFLLLAEALGRCRIWFGADRKMVSLSLCRKTFKLKKVIKSFVRELRSHKCFSCFGIPMLSIYVRYGHYERFAYRYEYVYFTYSYLGHIVDLDGNVTDEALCISHCTNTLGMHPTFLPPAMDK